MTPDDRLAELIAAAVADQLTPEERAELDRRRAIDPSIDREIDDVRAVTRRLAGEQWEDVAPDGALARRILGALAETEQSGDVPAGRAGIAALAATDPSAPSASPPSDRRPRRWMAPLLAAACLVVGLVIGVGAGATLPGLLSGPPSGPPGTLGAVERVDLREELAGGTIEADVVAHTWGTEAVLEATGLDVGATYAVVFVGRDGGEFSAGEMLGSEVAIHCRLNAAVLREDVARLEIRLAGAEVVAAADLPRA